MWAGNRKSRSGVATPRREKFPAVCRSSWTGASPAIGAILTSAALLPPAADVSRAAPPEVPARPAPMLARRRRRQLAAAAALAPNPPFGEDQTEATAEKCQIAPRRCRRRGGAAIARAVPTAARHDGERRRTAAAAPRRPGAEDGGRRHTRPLPGCAGASAPLGAGQPWNVRQLRTGERKEQRTRGRCGLTVISQ